MLYAVLRFACSLCEGVKLPLYPIDSILRVTDDRAMSSQVLFCTKITVERGVRAKCTTLFFKERIILTEVSRASGYRVCQRDLLWSVCMMLFDCVEFRDMK